MGRYRSAKLRKFSKLLLRRGFILTDRESRSSVLIENPARHYSHEDITFLLESANECRIRLKGFGNYEAFRAQNVKRL